jgi:hypothetical protein
VRRAALALLLTIAPPVGAQTVVTIANPSPEPRDDALVVVLADTVGAGTAWSAIVDGERRPAQRVGRPDGSAAIVFTADLDPHARVRAELVPEAVEAPPRVAAVLNVQTGSHPAGEQFVGGTYKQLDHLDVPPEHLVHDNLIAFEGPGWESDRVAYRLYLDERNVTDVFGKKQPAPILGKIGMGGDDYHADSSWGMDIFQVDQSLGVGGLGTIRNGMAEQIGPAAISATVEENGPVVAAVRVEDKGWRGLSGPVNLSARYSIAAGSRVTHVEASLSDPDTPLVAGLTHHEGVAVIAAAPAAGRWGYLASYGRQSLAGDRLGIVLFYPGDEGVTTHDDGRSLYIRFADPRHARYAFAAAWQQEPKAPKTEAAFRRWVAEKAAELARPATVATAP